jgi:hypothetical protein
LARRILDLGKRFTPGKPRRDWLAVISGAFYLFIKVGLAGFEDAISRLVVLYAAKGRARMVSFPTVYQRVVVHWRAIIVLLILAVATVPIAYGDFLDLITLALFLLFIASQGVLDRTHC